MSSLLVLLALLGIASTAQCCNDFVSSSQAPVEVLTGEQTLQLTPVVTCKKK